MMRGEGWNESKDTRGMSTKGAGSISLVQYITVQFVGQRIVNINGDHLPVGLSLID